MKLPRFYQTAGTNFSHQKQQFFINSTLHGVRYFAEKGRTYGEKLMWFCFIAIGAVAAFVIIGSLWEKFQTNPTITGKIGTMLEDFSDKRLTGLDTEFHNNYLYFPTVTVCPLKPFDITKVNETAMQTIARYEPGYEVYIPTLEMLPKFSYTAFNLNQIEELTAKFNDETIKGNSKLFPLRNLIFQIAVTCTELFITCFFSGEKFECCEKFKVSYSEQGFCYSFNGRYYSDKDGETKNTELSRLLETDTNRAIKFVISYPSEIFVHSTEEVFSYDNRPQFKWEPNFSIDLLITMKQTYTTEDTRQLSTAQRKCVFEGEENLNYYENEMYSASACLKECRMKKALQLCKCVPPFYASKSVSKSPKCWVSNLPCLKQNQKEITSNEGCEQCQLSCLTTVYESERFRKNLVKFGSDNVTSAMKDDFYISIGFLAWPIIRYKREVLFGWVDLLVSFGGIAGLFLGFSLLSGLEIVYFFTIRAGCMHFNNREKLYKLHKEKVDRPITHYDLSLTPKVGEIRRSQSMTSVRTVKPINTHPKYGFPKSDEQTYERPSMNGPYSRHRKLILPRRTNKCSAPGCKKSFHKNSLLNRHMLSHTKEKTYQCDQCTASYSHSTHLYRHQEIVHLGWKLQRVAIKLEQFSEKLVPAYSRHRPTLAEIIPQQ